MSEIVVAEDVHGPELEELERAFAVDRSPELWRDETTLAARLEDARALIVRNRTQVTASLIRAAPRLEVIGRAGAGLDNVNVAAATEAGVVVTYTPDQNSVSVAELAMGLLTGLARSIPAADRDTRHGGWSRQAYTGTELMGKTLGLVGFGRIGFLTAMRARAFGMDVLAHDPFAAPDAPTVVEARAQLLPLEELLAKADFVSCHLPVTESTRGLFDASRFASMKRGACFLNLSRGELVDEAALVEALQQGPLAGAALDVRATEPPERGVLETMEQVVLTPHIGAFTHEAQGRVASAVCRDVGAVLRGEPAMNFRNFPRAA